MQGTYGLLEQKVNLIFQNPHFRGNRNFGLTFTGGYANSQDVTTYVASRLDAGLRLTQNFNSPRLVLVARQHVHLRIRLPARESSRGQSAGFSQRGSGAWPRRCVWAVRALRGFATRATRPSTRIAAPTPAFRNFFLPPPSAPRSDFNRIDVSNSSFYGFDKNRFVLARNTRYGQERAFGDAAAELIPLPERLYAGGATSLRGFSINAAGPRDRETGFPIGGAGALVNSTELRLPPPTLPYFGNSVSFVLFHDMGNVFTNAGDAWTSALRVHQPDRDTCKALNASDTSTNPPTEPLPDGPRHLYRTAGNMQLQLLHPCAGVGVALPYAGRSDSAGFQLQPESAHLPGQH